METVKGFRDYAGQAALKRAKIKSVVEDTFRLFGFEPAETPVIEYEEFVKGNNQDDEAVSDVFRLQDKGRRKLALRYELTFPLKRVMKNKKLPYRRYSIGPVFRDEPATGNRTRQFTSCDADIIGSSVKEEAEILKIASEILSRLNIKFNIYFNNRKLLNEILDEFKVKDKEAVIREIDKLDKLGEKEVRENLKKYKAEKVLSVFKEKEAFFRKYKAYSEIKELKKYLKMFGVKAFFQPSLARGLSYYNGTVFEIKSFIKETVFGGGSYIFNNVQCCGFGVSIERLEVVSEIEAGGCEILIISLNQDKEAIELASLLREQGYSCSIYYGKPGKALEYANSYKIPYAIFLGKQEVEKGRFKLKEMGSGEEKLVSVKDFRKKVSF
jgi:histidyl-tRNA synthetase